MNMVNIVLVHGATTNGNGGKSVRKKPSGKNRRATNFLNGFEKNTEGLDDHEMSREELKDYLRNELGSVHFDDDREVNSGVNEAFNNVDVGGDGTISLNEMTNFWAKLKSLKTVENVVDWIKYSVQLPQYENTFRDNAITGYDLPTLLEGNGEVLKRDLGIQNTLHRRIILRSITTRLLGIGKMPLPLKNMSCYLLPNCNGIEIDWRVDEITPDEKDEIEDYIDEEYDNNDNNNDANPTNFPVATVESIIKAAEEEAKSQEQIPVHLYRFKRIGIEDKPSNTKSTMKKRLSYKQFEDKDYICKKLPFIDGHANVPGTIYQYKVQSWNLFGASKWAKHISCPPIPLTCKEIVAKKQASDQKRVTHFMNKIEWTTEGSNDLEIRREELNEFIRENLGKSENFDEDNEITSSVDNAFDTMDVGGDGVISRAEITAFWEKMDGLQTIDEIVDWVKYGLQLKQYEDNFRSNSITGDVLPTLLTKKAFLKNVLGITNELHILHFRRSLKARLLGLHKTPNKIKLNYCKSHCDRFEIFWNVDDKQTLTPHSYQVQERLSRINTWNNYIITSYKDRSFSSTKYAGKENDGVVEFRVRPWSSFGTTIWSDVTECPPRPNNCQQNTFTKTADGDKMGDTRELTQNSSILSRIINMFIFFKEIYLWLYFVFTLGFVYAYRGTMFSLIVQKTKFLNNSNKPDEEGTNAPAQSSIIRRRSSVDINDTILIENVSHIGRGNNATANSAKKQSKKRCQINGCTKRNKLFHFHRCIGLKGTFYREDGERECQKYFCRDHTGIAKYPTFICSECFNIGLQRFIGINDESRIDPEFKSAIKRIKRERRRDGSI